MNSSYAELQAKTCFSFLSGASHPSEMVERAAELGLRALAITDLNGVYALPKAFRQAKQHTEVKLISGAELTLRDHPPISFLAKNRAGYGLLCRMITRAHEGKPKGRAFLEWHEILSFLELPASESLIVIPSTRLDTLDQIQWRDLRERAADRIHLPLQRLLDGRDRLRAERVLALSQESNFPVFASNDAHYHIGERRMLHDVLTATRVRSSLRESGRSLFSNAERHLKSPQQMARLFSDLPHCLENSLQIADQCSFSLSELRYFYPSEWIPPHFDASSYLRHLVEQGEKMRYPAGTPANVQKQIQHELKLISELKFADYFLTIWEIVDFARNRNILCQGRGSAANSIVCYCLGITSVDPVRMDLLFERFISAERGEPPDIDVDFEHERREEVLQHVYSKYGRDRAGMVAAIITYRSRLAMREVHKALELVAPAPPSDPRTAVAARLADDLHGFPRHLSIHSGGFTLSALPIIETVPIEPARMEGRTIVQWDKEDLEIVGLLKVDLLSLGILSAIRKTLALIPGMTFSTIPAEDPATYSMIQRADTVGTFQIESRAQMSMLPRLKPKTFYDLVIQVAIVRPGPIQGGMVHPYLRRRRGEEPIDMPHPLLQPILGRTLGVPIFQEQVMKMAIVLARFTPGEADQLRRAIGAWRSSGEIDRLGRKLMERLLEAGLPQEFVDRIFKQIHGFAEYGFPESHAASFALIAYASAYLKCHHPTEFACGLINSQPMGFYSNATLVHDAKRHGSRILPVHPHLSEWDCVMEEGALRLGFRVVNGLGAEDAKALIEKRKQQPFRNLPDFVSRTQLRLSVLQALALSGAFLCFGREPRDALWDVLAYTSDLLKDDPRDSSPERQLSLFSKAPESWISAEPNLKFSSLSYPETLQADYTAYSLSTQGHPMSALRLQRPDLPGATSQWLKARGTNGQRISLAGMVIIRQRPPTAKGTCFATLEDEHGFIDLIFHASIYEKFEETFWRASFFIVTGSLQVDGHAISLIVKNLQPA